MAFVLFEIFCSINSGFIPNVSSSISTKTGFELTNNAAFAVEIKENDGTKISSEFPTPFESKLACNADVPELSVRQ